MWERMTEKRNEGGFTLIELLIVIIILAILAAIVVFAVGTTGSNAVAASCNADAKTFETALESYKAEVGAYPAAPNLQTPAAAAGTVTISNGQTWTNGIATVFGLEGNNGTNSAGGTVASASTWTSPLNQASVGSFLRELPSNPTGPNAKQHYQIYTDGEGGVFAVAPGSVPASLPATANFDTNPGICSTFS